MSKSILTLDSVMRLCVFFVLAFVYSCCAETCGCEITSTVFENCSGYCTIFMVTVTSITLNNVNITAENVFFVGSGGIGTSATEISISNSKLIANTTFIASADTDIISSTLNSTDCTIHGERLNLHQTDIIYSTISITLESTSDIGLISILSSFISTSENPFPPNVIMSKAPR